MSIQAVVPDWRTNDGGATIQVVPNEPVITMAEHERETQALREELKQSESTYNLNLHTQKLNDAESLRAERVDFTSQIEALRTENERLKLENNSADSYWDDDNDFESPEAYAEERDLKVGDEFELQAAAYWPLNFRVIKVADEKSDDYDCETIGERREDFTSWFAMKAENERLREFVQTINEAKCLGTSEWILWTKNTARALLSPPAPQQSGGAELRSKGLACTCCGTPTEWLCADCKIDTHMNVPVCGSRICREKHEATNCTRKIPQQSADAQGGSDA